MSRKTPGQWLLSHHSEFNDHQFKFHHSEKFKRAKTIAISSGKGGVGKTSVAIKMAKMLAAEEKKVLLIDCDYNLSNTAVKLGLPLDGKFYDFFSSGIDFDEALYKDGNFHLLSGCNGNFDLFDSSPSAEGLIISVIEAHRHEYDIIILDCPAGLNKNIALLNSYCDFRFVIITPDRSSITDSYSLIKILERKLSIKEFHLIFNKVSGQKQYCRLRETFLKTSANFLECHLKVLGAIAFFNEQVDHFDRELLKVADSKIHRSFYKVVKMFTEEEGGNAFAQTREYSSLGAREMSQALKKEHEVRAI